MIQEIVNLLGQPTELAWLPELLAGIVFIILVSTALSFVFNLISSIFKF